MKTLEISHVRFEILRDVIVRDFSMSLREGEVKTLFGASGCGKTTLLRLVCGLENPKFGAKSQICHVFHASYAAIFRKCGDFCGSWCT